MDTTPNTPKVTAPYAGFVVSKDGTRINYRQLGQGPGLLLVNGAMGSSYNFVELAQALAPHFTVTIIERRGRGTSGAPGKDYGLAKEVEDLHALLNKTGARYIFGLSSGAVITLNAAKVLPTAIQKIALYEPPLFVSEPDKPKKLLATLDRQLARGDLVGALITGMQGGKMGPPFMNAMPAWLLRPLFKPILKVEDKKGSGAYMPMRELAPTLHEDFTLVVQMAGTLPTFKDMQITTLLLGGSTSPAYLKESLNALEKTLPNVSRVELPGLGHGGPWNYDKQQNKNGNPKMVAQKLIDFFS